MQEGLKELEILLDPYDWFYEVVIEARRYVVYVTYMDSTQNVIPDFVQGHQVVVHFASSAPGAKNEYVNRPSLSLKQYSPFDREPDNLIRLSESDMEVLYATEPPRSIESSIKKLTDKLDRLEKEVGSNTLQDIFYEIHDGRNAVTNLGSRYPDVQASMKRLYDEYGFDTIYNELDG